MLQITNEMKKDILAKFDGVNLSGNLTELNWEDVIKRNMKGVPYKTASGVSKCVFMFRDFPNLVVKIPFSGYGTDIEEDLGSEEPYEDYSNVDEEPYEDYSNAALGCGGHALLRDWDYCEAETTVYNDALRAGVADFFAETVYIGAIDNHPIYIQEIATIYANVYYDYAGKYTREERREYRSKAVSASNSTITDDDCWIVNQTWFSELIEEYGAAAASKLIAFLIDEGVDDLHIDNLGFIDGKPVIVDYSSFNS